MSAAPGKPVKGLPERDEPIPAGARVDLPGEWRILVVMNMADDETGEPGV
jgi:hypothetical protein